MTFLTAFIIWYLIGFIASIYMVTRYQDFTITDLFLSTILSICGLTIILFIIINKYGNVVIFKKRIK
jgi:hypothetical protein